MSGGNHPLLQSLARDGCGLCILLHRNGFDHVHLCFPLVLQNLPNRLINRLWNQRYDDCHISLLAQSIGPILCLAHQCRSPWHGRKGNIIGSGERDPYSRGHRRADETTYLRIVLKRVDGLLALGGRIGTD